MPNSNVLLIDDNTHQHELFNCYALNTQHIAVSCASSLEDGLRFIPEVCPDVILLDNRLAPFNTFKETAPRIRAIGYKGRIVVISADVGGVLKKDMAQYSISDCVDIFDFDLMNFEEKITKLMIN